MNAEEFLLVTQVFFNRLENGMSCAGCNDLSENELPKSICDKYKMDYALFDEWKKRIELIIEDYGKC